ncbi:MAG: hypothetical protein ACK5O2_13595, partial [Microthrixaceae bacterium]
SLLPELLNDEMVSLVAIEDPDREFLQRTVQRHLELTGSAVAAGLLDRWDDAVGAFTKVMPNDYQRVLDATARAESEGLDVTETIMAAAQR